MMPRGPRADVEDGNEALGQEMGVAAAVVVVVVVVVRTLDVHGHDHGVEGGREARGRPARRTQADDSRWRRLLGAIDL